MDTHSQKRHVIVAGGTLADWEKDFISAEDIVIGVDHGVIWALINGIKPNFAIGDFDSVPDDFINQSREAGIDLEVLNKEKDETDTEAALRWALTHQPSDIIILGGLGGRFDHTLANVHLLRLALNAGILCELHNETNTIRLINNDITVKKSRFNYVSLLPFTERVEGVTLTGFKYPLSDATLEIGKTIGISNELVGEEGHIQLKSGELLVILSKD